MNTGKKSKEHGIFNLGEQIPKNLIQVWDYLSKKRIKSAIWGPMNTNFKNNTISGIMIYHDIDYNFVLI